MPDVTNQGVRDRALVGALAGLSATIPMTAVMLTLYRMLPARERYGVEPRLVVEGLLSKTAPVRLSESQRVALTSVLHLAYGASAGAAWVTLDRRTLRSPVLHGTLGGLAVWAAGYLGWLPALRIVSPEYCRPAGRAFENVASHLVWGVCAAEIAAEVTARRRARQQPSTNGRH